MRKSSHSNPLPYEASQALRRLGANLKTARLRRNETLEAIASRIGVHRTTLSQVERGDPTVTASTYAAALWAYGLTDQIAEVGAPDKDAVGKAFEASGARTRARTSTEGLSSDF
ncbi:helix-turn-helix domain-containing protein [Methylobacterium haplocladii]|uniref:Transcriptional regulator n=1 Tax=Methylobacterium haplocladii TaxID=1176176 RepID=A0A512IUZ7_9HYPH|nr:helix-turn-helix transcriptional regulator [Methylobacterium haplocladii]GEP01496.1 transcriptional regulator [Methylobacterium haplocladii]GLS59147.1 transcriptional regulator [Methylobacterium haplocladii]